MTDPSHNIPDGRGHIPGLDGLRGIAVILVLIHHLVLSKELGWNPAISGWVHTGWIGVDLFFVLSGFLITGILVDAKGNKGYFKTFYMRRFLRIFPLYYAAIFVMLVLLPLVAGLLGLDQRFPAGFSSLEKTSDAQLWLWLYLQNYVAANYSMFNHFWSLAVEEHFYLFWPLLVYFLPRRAMLAACVVVIVLAFALRVVDEHLYNLPGNPYQATHARMDALALGGLIAMLFRRPGGWASARKWALSAMLIGGALMLAYAVTQHGIGHKKPIERTVGFTVIAFFFGGVITWIVAHRPGEGATRWLLVKPLTELGKIGYGMYVFHRLLMFPLGIILPADKALAITGNRYAAGLLWLACAVILTLIVATLSWRFFEAPILKLKKHFPYDKRTA
ncbi:MAG: acyltransferase family protein [Phycisphaeraceae bacterium]